MVAIKTNNIAQQHTRSAVMVKVCHTLTAILSVKPFNIHIYDACHGSKLTHFGYNDTDLPDEGRLIED